MSRPNHPYDKILATFKFMDFNHATSGLRSLVEWKINDGLILQTTKN